MRSFLIFLSFLFLLTDCASKGKARPLTYRVDMPDASFFGDLDDRVCDLSTLKLEAGPFHLDDYRATEDFSLDYSPGGDLKIFSQELKYQLFCKDSLKEREDENGQPITQDLVDTLFDYYADSVIPKKERDQETWKNTFFDFVLIFQKRFISAYDEEVYDRVKLVKKDLVTDLFLEERDTSSTKDKIKVKVERHFWTDFNFPVIRDVIGMIETKGPLTIEKREEAGTKYLTFYYESLGIPDIPSCSGCRETERLKNTKKITEFMELAYTPPKEDSDEPNVFITVKRKDVASKPGVANLQPATYYNSSRDLFETVTFSSAIGHFAHLARYLILQSPAGLRAYLHGQLQAQLNQLIKLGPEESRIQLHHKQDEFTVAFDRKDRLSLSLSGEKKPLLLDFEIPEKTFSSKGGVPSFLLIAAVPDLKKPWSKILGEEEGVTTLMRPIQVEDGLVKLGLFPKKSRQGRFNFSWGKKKGEGNSYDWVVLSRAFLYKVMTQEISRAAAMKQKGVHKPYYLEIQFRDKDKFVLIDRKTEREYIFQYEIDQKNFSDSGKSFPFVLTPKNAHPTPSMKNHLALEESGGVYTTYLKFDPKQGLLLNKKGSRLAANERDRIEEWTSIPLMAEMPFEGQEDYKALMTVLKSYNSVVKHHTWGVDIVWKAENVSFILPKKQGEREKDQVFECSYEIIEDSYDEEDASFTAKISLPHAAPQWLASNWFGPGALQSVEKKIRIKLEGETPLITFGQHRKLHAVAQSTARWLSLGRKAEKKSFEDFLAGLNTSEKPVIHKPLARRISIAQIGSPDDRKTQISFIAVDDPTNVIRCTVEGVDELSHDPKHGSAFVAEFACEGVDNDNRWKEIMGLTRENTARFKRRLSQNDKELRFEVGQNTEGEFEWLSLTEDTHYPGWEEFKDLRSFLNEDRGITKEASKKKGFPFKVNLGRNEMIFEKDGKILKSAIEVLEDKFSIIDGKEAFQITLHHGNGLGEYWSKVLSLPSGTRFTSWALSLTPGGKELCLKRTYQFQRNIGNLFYTLPSDWVYLYPQK